MKHFNLKLSAFLLISGLFLISAFTVPSVSKKSNLLQSDPATAGNARVNGGGTTIEGGAVSTFVFNAVQHNDGSVNGHLNYKFRFADIDIQMDIDCFEINGNMATLTGVVTSVHGDISDYPYIAVGARAAFTVRDNGQGSSSNPDLISDLLFGGTCASAFNPRLPISGNITIKE